jgi:hypothetical protein
MKKSYLSTLAVIGALSGILFISSCSDDDENFSDPVISISETNVTASPGEQVDVNVTISADPSAENVVITKLWDGAPQGSETISSFPSNTFTYSYTVKDEDADYVTVLNFLLTDSRGNTDEVELVIDVELTPTQILLKYNWRLNEEIRKATGENDINDVYTDDVYQFNADGTYQKSIGEKADDFSDLWYNYCYYDLNETTMRLLMSRTGAFGEEVTDTLNISVIDAEKMHADVTYYGLDVFDPTYDPVEEYEKRFVAVAKTDSFDPYMPGPDDDNTGPAGSCADVIFEND